jgi:hypothetical protein
MNHRTGGIAVLIALFFLWLPAWGQNTATVRGKVIDSTGRPVVSAFAVIIGH